MTPTNIDSLRYAFPRASTERIKDILWAVLLNLILPLVLVAGLGLWGALTLGVFS